jgi:hypothetical protein
LSDTLQAQDAMREVTATATFAVFVATALHAIAVGNMLPAFVDAPEPEQVRPLTTICVDQTEFVVNKLRDRGTHQAYGVVTNAQDFMHVLRFYVERWEQAGTSGSPRPARPGAGVDGARGGGGRARAAARGADRVSVPPVPSGRAGVRPRW